MQLKRLCIAPSMRIDTSDGRQLTGSQLDYAWVPVADSACGTAQDAASMGYIQEFETLRHPALHQL